MSLFIQNSIHMNELENKTMNNADYPQLYRAADNLSIQHQKEHFRLLFGYLSSLVIGSAISIFCNGTIANSISLLLFILSAVLFAISKILNPLDLWYNGRAVAESVKSMTWKWMMKAEPYQDIALETAFSNFKNDLHCLLHQNKTLFSHYQNEDRGFDCISEKMKEVRKSTAKDRLSFYNRNRVENQLNWYRIKTKRFHKLYIIYSLIVAIFYAAIIILMIVNISMPNMSLPIELISAFVTSIVSWMEAKKYNELSCAYSLAVNDISIINANMLEGDVTDNEVSEYVINSENAFSREHTQWIARKQ